MPNRRFNTQVAQPMKKGGRVKRKGGGMGVRTMVMVMATAMVAVASARKILNY